MSRLKTAKIRAIALQVFRDFTESVLAEFAAEGLGRDDFTRRQVFVFSCDGEEFVAYDGYHVMDTRWSDELWTRFPRATAERIQAECRAILAEHYEPTIAVQRAIMDALFRETCAWDMAQTRVMNAKLSLLYRNQTAAGSFGAGEACDVPATGRITRLGRGGKIVFQFVSQCHPAYNRIMGGSVVEVIESDEVFTLRKIVAGRMAHAPRSVA